MILTLTTDFGAGSSYVAAMKGVVLSIHPSATIVDLTHDVPPQNLRFTGYFLAASVFYYPPGSLHVVVVDPGVGSRREILYVELNNQKFLVPDNGCWTFLLEPDLKPARVIQLNEANYWRPTVSSTFHGRDIFAPAAGHLSRGLNPELLGPPTNNWTSLEFSKPEISEKRIQGEVVFIDPFGNLLSNIPKEALEHWDKKSIVTYLDHFQIRNFSRTYSESPPGEPTVLFSSMNTVEIAVNHGNAARELKVKVGTPIILNIP